MTLQSTGNEKQNRDVTKAFPSATCCTGSYVHVAFLRISLWRLADVELVE